MAGHTGATSIDNLDATWTSIQILCAGLSDDEWDRPTGCPGWTVKDTISHLVDYEAGAVGRPRPDHVPADLPHVKNPLGEANEVGVDARRSTPGSDVLAELAEVTAERLVQLRGMTEEDFAREIVTPAGPGTVDDMLTLRVMDTWSHEQDIRRALGRPGHDSGPVVEQAVGYFTRFLPLLVGKRAGAPDGSSVVFAIGDAAPLWIAVAGGRANVVAALPGAPTVALTMPAATFAAHVGGRSDAPDDAVIEGDVALGAAVIAALGFMP
jgi:uncharacterized protein (TIGR03083 family)